MVFSIITPVVVQSYILYPEKVQKRLVTFTVLNLNLKM
jgi:hypothetical protein